MDVGGMEIGGNRLHGQLQCQAPSTTRSRATHRAIQGTSSDDVATTTSEASEPASPTSESEIGGNGLHGKLQCQTHSTTGSRGTQRAIQGPSSDDVATPTSEALQHQADECGEDQGGGFQMTRGNKRYGQS